MRYREIVSAEFLERPNRFIAYVELMGERTKVHVKNTGRCRELLTDHTKVYLEKNDSEKRSTAYDLVAVEKKGPISEYGFERPESGSGRMAFGGGIV